MNYFESNTAARNYLEGRPDFHSIAVARISKFLGLSGKVERALDIACGTGLSTKALLPIASSVYGTDTSAEMLRLAYTAPNIQYVVASAERQPYPDHSFELITVCSGVHWFDIDTFLLECARLLKQKAWLVLYDNFFMGVMDGNAEFTAWYEQRYLMKFPAPPRNNKYDWSRAHIAEKALHFEEEEQYSNLVAFNKEGLIQYLITQSNVIAVADSRSTSYSEAIEWLNSELGYFFPDASFTAEFLFGNWIKYIQAPAA